MRSTVLAKSRLWASKLTKSSHWPQILSKKRKQCAFHENCTKPFFRVMRSTFWPNRIFNCQSSQNRETRPKVSSKRKSSALSMKIGQNALFRSCATRFGQIAFLSVKVLKIVTRGLKFSPKRENGALFMKIVQNALFRSCGHVLAKSNLWASNFSKSLHLSSNSLQNGKTVRFSKLYKTLMRGARFGEIAFVSVKVVKSSHWPQILSKKGK